MHAGWIVYIFLFRVKNGTGILILIKIKNIWVITVLTDFTGQIFEFFFFFFFFTYSCSGSKTEKQCSGLRNKISGQRTDNFSPRTKNVSPQKTQCRKNCRNRQSRDWLVKNYFIPFEILSVRDWKLKPILIPGKKYTNFQ